jgi:hypothetical protein
VDKTASPPRERAKNESLSAEIFGRRKIRIEIQVSLGSKKELYEAQPIF